MKTNAFVLFISLLASTNAMAMSGSLTSTPPGIDSSGEISGGSNTVTGRIVNNDINAAYNGGHAGSGYNSFRVIYPRLQQYQYGRGWVTLCNINAGNCKVVHNINFSYDIHILRATGVETNQYRRNDYISPYRKTTSLTGWTR